MKLALVLASASLLLLTSCTSLDPYTGEEGINNTTAGIGLGAITGALAGIAVSSKSDRKKGAITGALGGAAVGGGIGYYMDRQETKLRNTLKGSGVQVRRDGDNLILVMPGNITFQSGKFNINSSFFSVLDSVSLVLKEFESTVIKVAGHTDSQGSSTSNQVLSEKRADSVRTYLIHSGVSYGRVQAVGYGQRYPVGTNSTASGRESNRRVELTLEPIK